jgi:hypothetical protein
MTFDINECFSPTPSVTVGRTEKVSIPTNSGKDESADAHDESQPYIVAMALRVSILHRLLSGYFDCSVVFSAAHRVEDEAGDGRWPRR